MNENIQKKAVFECTGHAFNRKFFHTAKDGKFNEFTVPAGAALIRQLLSGCGGAEYVPPDGTYRCECFELQSFENGPAKKPYYAAGRRLGFTEGKTALPPCGADYVIVADEGLGNITLPEGDAPVLWASDRALPDRTLFDAVAGRCLLLLDADVLRNAGAMISRKVSWERSATDLIWQLQHSPVLSRLLKAPHMVITFAEDGAVHVRQEDGRLKASLTLAHGGGEGFLRGTVRGAILDSFALMTAAVAMQLPEVMTGIKPLHVLPALKAAGSLVARGYSPEELASGRIDLPATEPGPPETPFDIPFASGQRAVDPDFWCISNSVGNRRIFDIACEYVLQGSRVIEGLPRLSFGALTTIDRLEIESYQNVCNLIVNYAATDSVRPLSIAVFGAPGSGKSFGVTQIAKNVLPGKVEKLEFNVSQFTAGADLGAAFQKVRDATLEGRLPLVFFDEFDSDRDGTRLGWIKSFLMPMQDGKFRDESGEHPLGKCILVFAGGTSSGFDEFARPMSSDDPLEQKAFRDIKGPDFISRLRGTVNVLGPNPSSEDDRNYILRRALLLRSLCERRLKTEKGRDMPVGRDVLRAMLLVPRYRHGARSMEAILDMSRIEKTVWEPASLPFHSQLALHVDADAFIRLVLREVILNSCTEKLAIAIHEHYRMEMTASGHAGHPSVVPWNELPEEFRESNRNQARDMAAKLKSVGYDYDSGDTPFPSVERFDRETILLLARKEHTRWCDEKQAGGWSYAPLKLKPGMDRDEAIRHMRKKKHSHLLTEWESLEREEQDKDIRAVENIIPLLQETGLRVYKTV
jgi:hypothetical protein